MCVCVCADKANVLILPSCVCVHVFATLCVLMTGSSSHLPHSGLKVCSFRVGTCEVRYSISTDVEGTEDAIYVVMDTSQQSIRTLQRGSMNCDTTTPIWPIFVGIILAIIVVGVLALLLWRCCTYIGVSLNFKVHRMGG